jgi:polar amino acid transport system permease protein
MTGPRADVSIPGPGDGTPPLLDRGRGSRLLGNRAFLVSSASTIAFFGLLTAIVVLSPGFAAVRQQFFSLRAMRESFFGVPGEGLPAIWRGFLLNVEVFLIAEVLILILALVIAVIRQIPGPVFFPFRLVAVVYTDLFRGTPLLLVIFLLGFGVPSLSIRGFPSSVVFWGGAALVLSYSAYVAEVFRAGIESVHQSQTAAARALGLSRWQALRFVVIPQAVRGVIPPLLNDFVSLQKDTALLAPLGAIEAVRAAQIYTSYRFNYSPYVITAFLFVLLTIPLARFTDHLIERDRRRRTAGVAR